MAAHTSPIPGLSRRAERTIQRLSTLTVVVVALGAAILSFSGLQTLAVVHGFDPRVAWLLPVIVDGTVLTGSLGVVAAGLVGIRTWYPWLLTLFGVAVSVWGNVASAPQDLVSQAVHAIAPLTFALSVEGMLRIYRASAQANAQREHAAGQAEERQLERDIRTQTLTRHAAALDSAPLAAPEPPAEPAGVTFLEPATEATPELVSVVTAAPPIGAAAPRRTKTRQSRPAVAQTSPSTATTAGARERILDYHAGHPEANGGEIARALNLDPSYTRKILRTARLDTVTQLEAGTSSA